MSYHCLIFLTVAFKVLPFYVFIRLLVASYLFMSSYGHFTYFWKKGDFSLYRFCQVTEASLYFLTELRCFLPMRGKVQIFLNYLLIHRLSFHSRLLFVSTFSS
jgi:hypothetical protein